MISDEGIQNLRQQINDIQRQRQAFAISHNLKPSEAFYHNAYSDTVSVKAISGEITDAKMRCIGKSEKADVGQLNQGKSWTFINIYPQFAIFVSGSEGTEIQLSGEWQEESGNLWAARDNTSKLHQRLSRYVWTDISRR